MSCPPLNLFQIGWICALPIETAAAREMLDEDFGILEEQDTADPNTYRLGRIGKHNIVIACLPQYGNTSATTVANNMLRTFSRSLRIGLMVGVGGGIPSTAHDVRLGDIVISYLRDTCGGVIQYDMGKVVIGGEFDLTGSLNGPPRALLTAVNAMRAAELTDEPQYHTYLYNAIQRTTRTRKNFSRPTVDRLFQSIYDHPADTSNCDACPADWEEVRSEREDSGPQAHYGIIASGNAVIKHGEIRDHLGSKTGALCFEMEAAGLMLDFPCIVIRGVCDYADSHKNKDWQGYAALAAASYSKELLGYVPVGQISQEGLAKDICDGIINEVRGASERLDRAYDQQEQHHREIETRALTDQQRQCHRLFKLVNYVEQKNINPRRAQGTCEWVFNSSEYTRWLEGNSPGDDLLWISADPGCGKSVLARSIIDELEATGAMVCYFFFKDNEEQNSLAGALCSVLHQVFSQYPHLLSYATPAWDKNGDKLREEVDELWQILLAATLAVPSKTICIFDALDECRQEDQARLIEKLKSFHRKATSSSSTPDAPGGYLKFMFTARPYDHIASQLQGATDSESFSHLRLRGEADNSQIRREIDLVVRTKVAHLAKTAQLSSDIRSRLEQQLLQMNNRTYLWLRLALNDIRSTFRDSLRPAQESIELIPPSVTTAYQKILANVPSGQEHVVRKILKIIVAARRPLTIEEMAVMLGLATSPQSRRVKDATLNPSGLELKIRRLCGLFVFVENSKVYLIHQTAKEFLIQNGTAAADVNSIYPFPLGEAHAQLSEISIRYLLMEDLQDSDVTSVLVYSAEHWADHVRTASPFAQNEVDALLLPIYDTSTANFGLWFPIFWKRIMPRHEMPTLDAIHLAAFNGHEQVVRKLVASDERIVNKSDETDSNGLFWASRNGHKDVVRFLLESGSNPNARSGPLGSVLYAASLKGHEEVVRILLNYGADVNARCAGYNNVKRMGTAKSYEEILQTFHDCQVYEGELHHTSAMPDSDWHSSQLNGKIRQDDDGNITQLRLPAGEYTHALYAASSKGHKSIVQMLLEKGADANARGGLCGNALQGACAEGHSEIIRMLLEWRADPNYQGPFGSCLHVFGSCLHVAIVKGNYHDVLQLLEHGADVKPQNSLYETPLQAACSRGYDRIVQMLLEHGVNVDNTQMDIWGGTPLQAACSGGYDLIVQMLLEHGADVDNPRYNPFKFQLNQVTPLQAACSGGHVRIVQMLLEHGAGASVNSYRDSELREPPLLAACSRGYDQIAQMLLEHGADINIPWYDHFQLNRVTPLQAACSGGHIRIVQMLLEHGVNVNIQSDILDDYGLAAEMVLGDDQSSENPLQIACSGGYDRIVQMLLEHGANVNTHNRWGDLPLHTACSRGYDRIVQMLLEHGADVNLDSLYRSPLMAACSGGYDRIVQMLLEHGADVTIVDELGLDGNNTVLQAARRGGYDNIVQLLLEHGAEDGDHGE